MPPLTGRYGPAARAAARTLDVSPADVHGPPANAARPTGSRAPHAAIVYRDGEENGMTFLYLNSDRIGQGDAELGRTLLLLFLQKLVASEVRVDFVACLNGAALLTTEEGPALDSLRALAVRGATVTTCGTCLDHLRRRDALRIGAVGGMQQTVELFAAADRVIAPC